MLIFDDIFKWEGWGGVFKLAAGRCHLRLYDLKSDKDNKLFHLKPLIAIVQDLPDDQRRVVKSVSVRSSAGHIATKIVETFDLDPLRMVYIEYYPESWYGEDDTRKIDLRFDVVNFKWHENKALKPSWEPLRGPLLEIVKSCVFGDS